MLQYFTKFFFQSNLNSVIRAKRHIWSKHRDIMIVSPLLELDSMTITFMHDLSKDIFEVIQLDLFFQMVSYLIWSKLIINNILPAFLFQTKSRTSGETSISSHSFDIESGIVGGQ